MDGCGREAVGGDLQEIFLQEIFEPLEPVVVLFQGVFEPLAQGKLRLFEAAWHESVHVLPSCHLTPTRVDVLLEECLGASAERPPLIAFAEMKEMVKLVDDHKGGDGIVQHDNVRVAWRQGPVVPELTQFHFEVTDVGLLLARHRSTCHVKEICCPLVQQDEEKKGVAFGVSLEFVPTLAARGGRPPAWIAGHLMQLISAIPPNEHVPSLPHFGGRWRRHLHGTQVTFHELSSRLL